jgi:hypothetical protein
MSVKSLYLKVLTLSYLLPLTSQSTMSFWSCPKYYISLLLTVLDNLQQFKYSNKSTVYIFLTGLCASCFCTVHLVRVRLKMWMGEDSACQYASCVIASNIKHNDVYYQVIIITLHLLYYTILTTNNATNKVSCLLYFRAQCQQYTRCVYNRCLQSMYIHTKLTYKSATSNIHSYFTEIPQACRTQRNENAKLYAS